MANGYLLRKADSYTLWYYIIYVNLKSNEQIQSTYRIFKLVSYQFRYKIKKCIKYHLLTFKSTLFFPKYPNWFPSCHEGRRT